jgi:hypothetical protein
VAIVTGKARCLLIGERVGLNLLARCSGIATQLVHLNPFPPLLSMSGLALILTKSFVLLGLIKC